MTMTLPLITDINLAPTFATDREIDFCPNALVSEEQKATINAISDAYGFDYPDELVDGDPRKLIISNEEVDFLGFHNGKFGLLMEFELAYLEPNTEAGMKHNECATDAEIKRLYEELCKAFNSEKCEYVKKYDKSEFFFTYHHDNFENGLCLVIFTPFVVDGAVYSSPYESKTALKDIVTETFTFLNEIWPTLNIEEAA